MSPTLPSPRHLAMVASTLCSLLPIVVASVPVPTPESTPAPESVSASAEQPSIVTEQGCERPWMPPVAAPVADPFRPPDGPYGPGNRGIEYETEPGQIVVAVDGGTVAFAGPVAGAPVVVIDHGGGLRSSAVHLLEAAVANGDPVTRGQTIGTADLGFHLGARLGSVYVDPAELLERRCVVVRLVPI